jgi:hypothetical protein
MIGNSIYPSDQRLERLSVQILTIIICVSLLGLLGAPLALRASASVDTPDAGTPGNHQVHGLPNPPSYTSYGTRGYAKPRYAYVEPGSYKVESVWVYGPTPGNFVEVGWWIPYGGQPEFFAGYLYNGQYYECDNNPHPTPNVFYRFQVHHVGSQTNQTWDYYLDTAYQCSATVNFWYGHSGGQGERHNTGDACFARWYGLELQLYTYPPYYWVWTSWPGPMNSYDGDPGCYLCVFSNTDFRVKTDGTSCP